MRLDAEEMALLQAFDTRSRSHAMREILAAVPYVTDEMIREICDRTIRHLGAMDDDEFRTIDFEEEEEENEE